MLPEQQNYTSFLLIHRAKFLYSDMLLPGSFFNKVLESANKQTAPD